MHVKHDFGWRALRDNSLFGRCGQRDGYGCLLLLQLFQDTNELVQVWHRNGSELSIVNVTRSVGLYREATALEYLGLSTSSLADSAGPVLGDLSQRQRMPVFTVRRQREVCDLQI